VQGKRSYRITSATNEHCICRADNTTIMQSIIPPIVCPTRHLVVTIVGKSGLNTGSALSM